MSEEITIGNVAGPDHEADQAAAVANESDDHMVVERVHALIMGRSGIGKTTAVATWEKPILLLEWDPVGKEGPLLRRGKPTDFLKGEFCYYREVYSTKDPTRLIARIEYWSEPNPFKPSAYGRWIKRSASLEADIAAWGIKTVVLDTANFFWLAAHNYGIEVDHPNNKQGQAHYGYSNTAVQQTVMMRIPNLLTVHSLVTCHEAEEVVEHDQDIGKETRIMPAFAGQLPRLIPGGFSEVWHLYVAKDGVTRLFQTRRRPDKPNDCKTLLQLPDPIVAHYEAIRKALMDKPA